MLYIVVNGLPGPSRSHCVMFTINGGGFAILASLVSVAMLTRIARHTRGARLVSIARIAHVHIAS